jgi:hypothetical protein
MSPIILILGIIGVPVVLHVLWRVTAGPGTVREPATDTISWNWFWLMLVLGLGVLCAWASGI